MRMQKGAGKMGRSNWASGFQSPGSHSRQDPSHKSKASSLRAASGLVWISAEFRQQTYEDMFPAWGTMV